MDEYIKREDALNALLNEMVGTGYQSRAMNAVKFIPTADVVPREEVDKIFEEVKNAFEPSVSALFMIGETLVDVSKCHISEEKAIDDMRTYMSKAICTRYRLEQTLDELKKKYTEEK